MIAELKFWPKAVASTDQPGFQSLGLEGLYEAETGWGLSCATQQDISDGDHRNAELRGVLLFPLSSAGVGRNKLAEWAQKEPTQLHAMACLPGGREPVFPQPSSERSAPLGGCG